MIPMSSSTLFASQLTHTASFCLLATSQKEAIMQSKKRKACLHNRSAGTEMARSSDLVLPKTTMQCLEIVLVGHEQNGLAQTRLGGRHAGLTQLASQTRANKHKLRGITEDFLSGRGAGQCFAETSDWLWELPAHETLSKLAFDGRSQPLIRIV